MSGVKGVYEFNRGRGNYWEIVGTKGALRGDVLHPFEGDQKFEIRIVQEDSKIHGAKVDTTPEIYVENHLQEYPLESIDEIAIADAWLSLYNAIEHDKPHKLWGKNARKRPRANNSG